MSQSRRQGEEIPSRRCVVYPSVQHTTTSSPTLLLDHFSFLPRLHCFTLRPRFHYIFSPNYRSNLCLAWFQAQSLEMAEVQSRPSRGRGSNRGRGGFSSRGGGRSASRSANNAPTEVAFEEPLDDQGELGQLKKQYKTELSTLKELFPDWTSDDLVFALQETDGDLETTVERITEGAWPTTLRTLTFSDTFTSRQCIPL